MKNTKTIEWIGTKEVAELTGSSKPLALKVIKKINKELSEQGFIIASQFKVPKHIVLKRLGIETHGTNTLT